MAGACIVYWKADVCRGLVPVFVGVVVARLWVAIVLVDVIAGQPVLNAAAAATATSSSAIFSLL